MSMHSQNTVVSDDPESLTFNADVARLLDIVAGALYAHQDVFCRELISNASDACDRLRYDSLTRPDLVQGDPDFRIRIEKNTADRTFSVSDNGVGMTRAELIDNLGTIAKSGTAALMAGMQNQPPTGGGDPLKLIGQFGVGFYACFMVAHRAEVISRRAGEDAVWHWESDGKNGFSVRAATPEEGATLEGGRGTRVLLHLKDSASDFLIDEKIRLVVQRYSDHIGFPVFLGRGDAPPEKPVNAVSAIWMRSPAEVSQEDYVSFFRHITMGTDDPMMTAHWRAEGTMDYAALLFVPSLRPWDLFDPARRHAVKLHVRRVFITDHCEGLIYPWLRFLRGVIDSEDLPLNISRESLQFNPVIAKIRRAVGRRILSDLQKMAESDLPAFETLWLQFGAVLKEGLYESPEVRPELFSVARFHAMQGENVRLTALADYKARMKDGQTHIYYLCGENPETLRNSPQLEGFRARGLEVLFLTDPIDDFWLQMCPDFEEKPFRSITQGAIDLSHFPLLPADGKDSDGESCSAEKSCPPTEAESGALESFRAALAAFLADDVADVRFSGRLQQSPVCFVAAEGAVDMNLERVLKIHQKRESDSKRILEINAAHPLIRKLATLTAESPDFPDCARLLLDQAKIIHGDPLEDPAGFITRLSLFMTRGLEA